MLVTDRDDLLDGCSCCGSRSRTRRPPVPECRIAFKYKMSSLQAALGLAQLERIEELVERSGPSFAGTERELADATPA